VRWLLAWLIVVLAPAASTAPQAPVVVLSVNGAIGPASADYLVRGMEHAVEQGAQLVVIRMDTPGGLDTSMRDIIKHILASPVPVASFVAPAGARAASAGTFILYASHVAAMAPGTNLGAASPVHLGGAQPSLPERPKTKEEKGGKDEKKAGEKADELPAGGTLERKQMHDAAAYIRGLAQLRGRNAEWAERAVREAVSLTAEEALKMKVIDLTAADIPQLLEKLDGRTLTAAGKERALKTAGAAVVAWDPDWRTQFLSVITDPSIAYVLMLVGIYAIIFEFSNPGLVLPGVAGVISILIALYGLHMLPVNYAGLALIVIGIGFMVAEAFLPAYGSLGIGGLIAFIVGSVILIDLPGYSVPYTLIGGFAVASLAFLLFVAGMLLNARRRPVVSGREELVGAGGEVLGDFEREGWARVHSETWRVRSATPLRTGERVRVAAIDGLTLEVVPDVTTPAPDSSIRGQAPAGVHGGTP
jgi:membrane-bound serine protease (ClpP class)